MPRPVGCNSEPRLSAATDGKELSSGLAETAPRRSQTKFVRRLLVVATVGLAIRLFYVLVFRAPLTPFHGDALFYSGGATNLARGYGFIEPLAPFVSLQSASHPPLYLVYLSIIASVWNAHTPSQTVFMVWSCVLGTGSIVLIGYAAREIVEFASRAHRSSRGRVLPQHLGTRRHADVRDQRDLHERARHLLGVSLPSPTRPAASSLGGSGERTRSAGSSRARAPRPVAGRSARRRCPRLQLASASGWARGGRLGSSDGHGALGALQPESLRGAGISLDESRRHARSRQYRCDVLREHHRLQGLRRGASSHHRGAAAHSRVEAT